MHKIQVRPVPYYSLPWWPNLGFPSAPLQSRPRQLGCRTPMDQLLSMDGLVPLSHQKWGLALVHLNNRGEGSWFSGAVQGEMLLALKDISI
jgi:hypothetical protein